MSGPDRERIEKAAADVMGMARNQLVVNFRFMDPAVGRLKLLAADEVSGASTDGECIAYNPIDVLRLYRAEKSAVPRLYMHLLLHCVYQHLFVGPSIHRELWDLAADMAVENSINELDYPGFETAQAGSQRAVLEKLKGQVKYMTAEYLYRFLMDLAGAGGGAGSAQASGAGGGGQGQPQASGMGGAGQGQPQASPAGSAGKNRSQASAAAQMEGLKSLFTKDNHASWYQSQKLRLSVGLDSQGSGTPDGSGSVPQPLKHEWRDVAEHIQVDLEHFAERRKNQGLMPGGFIQNLREVNRERYDYTAFLKKFAVMGEAMRVNDDEFDYIYYTYGLKLYKKLPLIEPLEYKEIKAVKEFVVAIDTSGSTSGELVQRFVQKTYNILKQEESFFTKINLHIIQCDAAIQEDKKITSQEEFDNYLKTMQIRGLGGTDFRPVFSYVDRLIKEKEFTNLKGMIYFTDGWGTFPARQPDYQAAVVYVGEDYNNPQVPVWAIRLVLRPEEI